MDDYTKRLESLLREIYDKIFYEELDGAKEAYICQQIKDILKSKPKK